jgi:hypothetical protein
VSTVHSASNPHPEYLAALATVTPFKAYVVTKVGPINAHYECPVWHNVVGVDSGTDVNGYYMKLLTVAGWQNMHSPFPIQVTRNAADIHRLTPEIT